MPFRTYEKNAENIELASGLDDFVKDKREHWRANSDKASQRHRSYKKRLNKQILLLKDTND